MMSLLMVYLIPFFTSSPLWSSHFCWEMSILLCWSQIRLTLELIRHPCLPEIMEEHRGAADVFGAVLPQIQVECQEGAFLAVGGDVRSIAVCW